MSLGWMAYRGASTLAGLLEPAVGWALSGEERAAWPERRALGLPRHPVHAWVHAASMGESLAAAALVEGLMRAAPGAAITLTTTTITGRDRLRARGLAARLAPLDTPAASRREFDALSPRRLFVIETELWFRWLEQANARKVPVVFVSARLSDRSLRRYRWLGDEAARLVHETSRVLAQTADDAERWRALGVDPAHVEVVGNLKNDWLPSAAPDRAAARAMLGLDAERPVLVLGSVRPGEVAMLARAWSALPEPIRGRWQVIAVPRHPGTLDQLQPEAREAAGEANVASWRWDGRMGVLANYYAVSDAAFVGGSLVDHGGHNPLEAAACGAAVLFGPHHATQREAVRALRARQALVEVAEGPSLAGGFARVLGDDAQREALGAAALRAAADERGAVARVIAQLERWKLWPA